MLSLANLHLRTVPSWASILLTTIFNFTTASGQMKTSTMSRVSTTIVNGTPSFAYFDTGCCDDTPFIAQRTITAFRQNATASFNRKVYYIIDPGKQGFSQYDSLDNTSVDDSCMTLVTSGGLRLKRVVNNEIF